MKAGIELLHSIILNMFYKTLMTARRWAYKKWGLKHSIITHKIKAASNSTSGLRRKKFRVLGEEHDNEKKNYLRKYPVINKFSFRRTSGHWRLNDQSHTHCSIREPMISALKELAHAFYATHSAFQQHELIMLDFPDFSKTVTFFQSVTW